MTGKIYLCEITLRHFRAFSSEFSVRLEPGPGVTIVLGPNGMGKTTLLEGIEWALTGKVRRLKHTGRALDAILTNTSAAERGLHHAVELCFKDAMNGEEHRIERGIKPPELDIFSLLKTHDRVPIGNVGTYLGITHFLSQSPSLRLAGNTSEERWQVWSKTPAFESIELLRSNVGETTRLRFASRRDHANQEMAAFTSDVELGSRHRTGRNIR